MQIVKPRKIFTAMSKSKNNSVSLDVIGLFLAGLINTFLAPIFAVIIFGPGTETRQPDLWLRIEWVAEHALQWKGGWLFWFAVTLSFAWSYFALGRHLDGTRPWRSLAIGLALIAAAVDLVGVLVNLVILPEIAQALVDISASSDNSSLLIFFQSFEKYSYALINVAAFGLYSVAGLLLMPAAFSTPSYPRWLAWLGMAEWGFATLATAMLVIVPDLAMVPLMISFLLFAPWVWLSAFWLGRRQPSIEP